MQMALPPDGARRDLERSLLEVARRTQTQTAGADGAGVTVLLGEGSVFAGSNGFTEALDEVQYRLDEGPCLSAVAHGHVVRSATIGSGERRWPDFTPRASALALRSVVSLPIRSGEELIGSINLYSRTPDGFATTQVGRLNESVQAAGRSLSSVRLLTVAQAGARTLAQALQERIDVDLAVGVLMDRYTINVNHARVLLAQLARQDGVTTASAGRTVLGQDSR